ncbi:hypothetical protein F5B22DRAFT_649595 [Xylaria bambusicola]|uniref:uncharacterized protein n=1 Tax=Xylaria bambusicola TaxID=326684 RepID=UPI0020081DAB|nr:uncharacterized protein F5B22DRAFT_649595 [Xylaria bambusicola]KAI0508895.1 hypothetical protein F5B22DRAFT_649595 [Xylaria bambusicola]
MEINFPNLINTAFRTRDTEDTTRGRNAIILSENSGPNHNEQGFLSSSFPRNTRTLFITSDGEEFDEGTLRAWREEGFEVRYFGLVEDDDRGNGDESGGGRDRREREEDAYRNTLAGLKDVANLGPCETFGIIAFGRAAGVCLEFFHHMANNPEFKLAVLVAYYPTRVPDPRAVFPGGLRVVCHLTGDEIGVVAHSQIVGIQGKRKVVRRSVERGGGISGASVNVGGNRTAYPCYWYHAEPGFAEGDLDEYDKVAAEVAWSRSLDVVHTAFRMDVELEGVVERNLEGKFFTRDLAQTMSTYTTHKSPHATFFPTLSGGIGTQELQQFYAEYFLSTNPDSTKLTLISRTVGADRVVDELHVSFKHTQPMPWILPGVPPTNKRVEVAIVSIVTLRGGRLYHEHVYWDQASVLVQVGLLDPKLIPQKAKDKGVKKLPVVGREAARRLVRGFEDDDVEDGEADNEMLPGWYDDEDDDEDDDVRGGDENEGKGENGDGGGENHKEKEKEKDGDEGGKGQDEDKKAEDEEEDKA